MIIQKSIFIKIKTSILIFMCCLFLSIEAQNNHTVNYNNPNIVIEGSNYVTFENNELVAHRHSNAAYEGAAKENLFSPKKARTGTGITLRFKTDSPSVSVNFRMIEGIQENPVFAIFKDDKLIENQPFKYKENDAISLKLNSKNLGKDVTYTITYPLFTDVHFLGLELDNGYDLKTIEEANKKTYVAFGDSITHGRGQNTTAETYPFILADNFGYELYNIAVGGGKTSQVFANMIRDDFKQIDLITILIGYNDCNGEGVDVETYNERYKNVLKTIRETHKDTKIYCITPSYTTQQNSRISQIPMENFREAVRQVVKDRQQNRDENIYLIEGESISSIENLKDKVHFSIEGAASFAEELTKIIN